MTKSEKSCNDELELIRKKGGGILRPLEVVKFARGPKTALHDRFEWDDGKAAEQYRLEQARLLIRCTVRLVGNDSRPVHAYVSIGSDRLVGDSYRALADVMTNKDLREKLIEQALREAESWKARYERFEELAPIFDAIERARKRRKG